MAITGGFWVATGGQVRSGLDSIGQPKVLWQHFCGTHQVDAQSVPLFESDAEGNVAARVVGRNRNRTVFQRSDAMEAAIRAEVAKLHEDWPSGTRQYDGLIYLMFWPGDGEIIPLYIGKAETAGRAEGVLSANLVNLERDRGKFARWGDGYAYHIGDLSACCLPGHATRRATIKYRAWASRLFAETPSDRPRLCRPVKFWVKAWPRNAVGIWPEFGATRLTFLEHLMIGVASAAYPDTLLNREGQNRNREETSSSVA